MMTSRVTSLDVAQRAGVSQSAVSRVFTPGASASEKTTAKVRKAAAELGYRPNSLARAMVSGKSGIIGLIVAYLGNQFYPTVLEQLSEKLQNKGYHVLVFMASQTAGNFDNVVEELLDYQVDGIIAASVALSSDLSERCRTAGVPMVLFNRSLDDPELSAVTSDNFSGGRDVARLLVAGRHRRIAYIAGWEGASTQRDREAGFRAGLEEAGLQLFARGVGDFKQETARRVTLDMYENGAGPDAIFVANDHMAFSVMDCLRSELGRRIPEDVSVIGYDDVKAAGWPAYDLTTVHQPAGEMVDKTVEILMEQIESRDTAPKQIAIRRPLTIRGSARIPKGWKHEGV
ncbi:MAG: LacI family DNA-binding transcriptional regulator [Parvularculales bacterium]